MDEVSGLELYREDATIYGGAGSIAAVPANYGKLVATVPQSRSSVANNNPENGSTESTSAVAASFYFDEWVPNVDDDWVKGTKGRLTASDKELIFQRSVTDEEKHQILNEINKNGFKKDRTEIGIIPDKGVVQLSHKNVNKKEIETLTAVNQGSPNEPGGGDPVSTQGDGLSLKIVDQGTIGSGFESSGVRASANYDCEIDKSIPDLAYCVFDYVDCAWCVGLGFSGPVAIACWIVICLDGGASVAAEFLTDIGCLSAGEHAAPCLANIVDQYAGQIPQPPSFPEPPGIPNPF